jgi:hypothetical protein
MIWTIKNNVDYDLENNQFLPRRKTCRLAFSWEIRRSLSSVAYCRTWESVRPDISEILNK